MNVTIWKNITIYVLEKNKFVDFSGNVTQYIISSLINTAIAFLNANARRAGL